MDVKIIAVGMLSAYLPHSEKEVYAMSTENKDSKTMTNKQMAEELKRIGLPVHMQGNKIIIKGK